MATQACSHASTSYTISCCLFKNLSLEPGGGAVPKWLQTEEGKLLYIIQEGLGIKWEEMVTQFKYFQKKQRNLSVYHNKGLIAR